ncbi:ROK family transcriptional regulator [Brachybacterium sp. GCM10030268]|uniref:ROK family transcriptional regulator n=1 Tax=Brachybacterium sp. GCM10030268 TaxID=3273382 RepID=UPI003621EF5E
MSGASETAMTGAVRRGTNLPRVAGYNQVLVLDLIRRAPGLSRSDLVRRTGLTMQTLSNICRRLVEAGLIREAGRVRSGMGAPRIVYEVEPEGRYAVGLHIDPARLTFAVLDLAGKVVAERTSPVPDPSDPPHVLDAIDGGVRAVLRELEIPMDRVAGLGVATPGPIDAPRGVVVAPPQLPGWDLVPLRDDLQARLEMPVVLEKDNTAAAMGEVWKAPRDGESFAFLYLGTGAAAGIVRDGEVLRGSGASFGNIAHMAADPDGPHCSCGGRGCVNVSAWPGAIVADGMAAGALEPVDTGDPHAVELALAELARVSREVPDSSAAQVLERAAGSFARVAVQLANLLDLDAIVFGGSQWPALEETFLRVVPELVNRAFIARSFRSVEVRGTSVGGPVGAIGAAALVLQETMFDATGQLHLQ